MGRQRTAEGFERSNELYEQALAIDPDYAAAWAGLSQNYINQAGVHLRPFDEGFQLASQAANRALTIDPNFAPAHATLSRIALSHGRPRPYMSASAFRE